MKFQRTGQWAQLSDNGNYSIACASVYGEYTFQAWKKASPQWVLLGTCKTAAEARDLCEAQEKAA